MKRNNLIVCPRCGVRSLRKKVETKKSLVFYCRVCDKHIYFKKEDSS